MNISLVIWNWYINIWIYIYIYFIWLIILMPFCNILYVKGISRLCSGYHVIRLCHPLGTALGASFLKFACTNFNVFHSFGKGKIFSFSHHNQREEGPVAGAPHGAWLAQSYWRRSFAMVGIRAFRSCL